MAWCVCLRGSPIQQRFIDGQRSLLQRPSLPIAARPAQDPKERLYGISDTHVGPKNDDRSDGTFEKVKAVVALAVP